MNKLRRALCVLVVLAFTLVSTPLHRASAASPIRVYIFAGQSNMVGSGTASSQLPGVDPRLTKPTPNVSFWGPTTDSPSRWGPLEAPTVIMQAMSHHGFGPEVSAAAKLAGLHPNTRIAVIKFAWSATNLHTQWSPQHHSLYPRMLDQVRFSLGKLRAQTGLPTKIAGFFWLQGESDSDTRAHATAYGKNLTRFIGALRQDLHVRNMPFVIGRIDDARRYEPGLPYTYIVRAQQASVARHVRYTHLVSTDGLQHSLVSKIHLATRGVVDLGRRFVQSGFGL